ncbi:Dinucleoside triphosphate hydrolase [Cryptotrichosporon argae]
MTRVLFSTFDVARQVFFRSPLSLAIVNLKPLLPGHVLVIPVRPVPRLTDLSPSEVSDLFLSVQTVGRALEAAYGAAALTVSVQDGRAAGQSVPHVHVHLIPRRPGDLEHNDDVYPLLEDAEGALADDLRERESGERVVRPKWDAPKDEDRRPRSDDEMEKEAQWLAAFIKT